MVVSIDVKGVDDHQDSFTVYILLVNIERDGQAPPLSWELKRRYRELAAFKDKIKQHLPPGAQFPGKTVGKASRDVVARRVRALATFFATLFSAPLPMTVQREIFELLDVRKQAGRTSEIYWRALKRMGQALPSASVLLQAEKWRREQAEAAHAIAQERAQASPQAMSPGGKAAHAAPATAPTATAQSPVASSPGMPYTPTTTALVDVSGHDLEHRMRQVWARLRAYAECPSFLTGGASHSLVSTMPNNNFCPLRCHLGPAGDVDGVAGTAHLARSAAFHGLRLRFRARGRKVRRPRLACLPACLPARPPARLRPPALPHPVPHPSACSRPVLPPRSRTLRSISVISSWSFPVMIVNLLSAGTMDALETHA